MTKKTNTEKPRGRTIFNKIYPFSKIFEGIDKDIYEQGISIALGRLLQRLKLFPEIKYFCSDDILSFLKTGEKPALVLFPHTEYLHGPMILACFPGRKDTAVLGQIEFYLALSNADRHYFPIAGSLEHDQIKSSLITRILRSAVLRLDLGFPRYELAQQYRINASSLLKAIDFLRSDGLVFSSVDGGRGKNAEWFQAISQLLKAVANKAPETHIIIAHASGVNTLDLLRIIFGKSLDPLIGKFAGRVDLLDLGKVGQIQTVEKLQACYREFSERLEKYE